MATLKIEKYTTQEKHYGKIKSSTKYEVLGKTYYASLTSLTKLKKILKQKGYKNIEVVNKGIYKMNF